MTCPICEQNLEIVEKLTDDFDHSTVVKYAICRDCRKQWKLKETVKSNTPTPFKKPPVGKGKMDKASKAKIKKISDDDLFLADAGENPAKAKTNDKEGRRKKQSKTPSINNRRKREGEGDKFKDRDGNKDRGREKNNGRVKNKTKDKGRDSRKKIHQSRPSTKANRYDDHIDSEESEGVFKPVRIFIAVVSILAFGYLLYQGGWITFFDHVIGQAQLSVAIAMIALGALCLIAGLILLFTLKRDGILPFIFPATLYLIGGVVAFFFRGDSMVLLAGSIVALIIAIILIILVLVQKVKSIE